MNETAIQTLLETLLESTDTDALAEDLNVYGIDKFSMVDGRSLRIETSTIDAERKVVAGPTFAVKIEIERLV